MTENPEENPRTEEKEQAIETPKTLFEVYSMLEPFRNEMIAEPSGVYKDEAGKIWYKANFPGYTPTTILEYTTKVISEKEEEKALKELLPMASEVMRAMHSVIEASLFNPTPAIAEQLNKVYALQKNPIIEKISKLYRMELEFRKEELKDKFYNGFSWEQILLEHDNAFLKLPEDERQAATLEADNKESAPLFIIPGTKLAHYVERRAEALRNVTGAKNASVVTVPFEELTRGIFNENNEEGKEIIAGEVHTESHKERLKKKSVIVSYEIASEDKDIIPQLDKRDLYYMIIVDGIYMEALANGTAAGGVWLTPTAAARYILGGKPTKYQADNVLDVIYRLRQTSIYPNNIQEQKEHNKRPYDTAIYALPAEIRPHVIDGKFCPNAINIIKRPSLLEDYTEFTRSSYRRIASEVLRVPGVNKTPDNCAIILELAGSIIARYTPTNKNGEKVIAFSTLWEKCNITNIKQRNKLKSAIEKCLLYWSSCNYSHPEDREQYAKTKDKSLYMPEDKRFINGFRMDRKQIIIEPLPKTIETQDNKK